SYSQHNPHRSFHTALLTHPSPPIAYTLSLHDALPISRSDSVPSRSAQKRPCSCRSILPTPGSERAKKSCRCTSETCRLACNARKDRKSTRLNSSYVAISYAVFCLKKKNITQDYNADIK